MSGPPSPGPSSDGRGPASPLPTEMLRPPFEPPDGEAGGGETFSLKPVGVWVAVVMLIGVALSVLMPGAGSRPATPRAMCGAKLAQLGHALHNYHDTFRRFPPATLPQRCAKAPTPGGESWVYSWRVAILPQIEQRPLYDEIITSHAPDGPPAWPDEPWEGWQEEIGLFVCPSDEGIPGPPAAPFGRASYRVCVGTRARYLDATPSDPGRCSGTILPRGNATLADIADGTSNTLLLGEARLGDASVGRDAGNVELGLGPVADTDEDESAYVDRCLALSVNGAGRTFASPGNKAVGTLMPGARWQDGQLHFSAFTAHLPPNSINCQERWDARGTGITSLGSRHKEGVNVAFADASVHFVHERVDLTAYRALATRAEGDDTSRWETIPRP